MKEKADLIAIAKDIESRCKTDAEKLEAINEYNINDQQKSRVRRHLGFKLKEVSTQEDIWKKEQAEYYAAIEKAKKRRPREIQKVVIKCKEDYDVTPLFIDCGG